MLILNKYIHPFICLFLLCHNVLLVQIICTKLQYDFAFNVLLSKCILGSYSTLKKYRYFVAILGKKVKCNHLIVISQLSKLEIKKIIHIFKLIQPKYIKIRSVQSL